MTAKVAEAQVPIGCPLGPRVWAVSPHWTIVLSAPAPSMVMNDLNGGMLTFSLDRHKKKKRGINDSISRKYNSKFGIKKKQNDSSSTRVVQENFDQDEKDTIKNKN